MSFASNERASICNKMAALWLVCVVIPWRAWGAAVSDCNGENAAQTRELQNHKFLCHKIFSKQNYSTILVLSTL